MMDEVSLGMTRVMEPGASLVLLGIRRAVQGELQAREALWAAASHFCTDQGRGHQLSGGCGCLLPGSKAPLQVVVVFCPAGSSNS